MFSGCRDSYPKPVVVVFDVIKKMSNRKGGGEGAAGQSHTAYTGADKKLRVAAYARVSSNSDDQLNSFTTQVDYYTAYIQSKEEWEFVGLYADEAASGTTTQKRNDFQRLLADCRSGKIDRILVKSISRFARNTIDCIQTVRELNQHGITVEFEKENIDTGRMGSEMLLSILGAAAQEESLSISSNLKWSYRRRMKSGDFITSKELLGYDFKNNTLIPNPEEAPIVQYIFHSFLDGKGTEEIAAELSASDIKLAKRDSGRWHASMIQYILTNEKYVGDALVQKKFTPDELPFRKKRNHGEVFQYYIHNSHPAIISRETFEAAQDLLRWKNSRRTKGKIQKSPLSGLMKCGLCGSTFHKHANNGEKCWFCAQHIKDKDLCPMPILHENEVHTAFLTVYNKLLDHKDMILKPMLEQLLEAQSKTMFAKPEITELHNQIANLTRQNHSLARLQAKGCVDPALFLEKCNRINRQIEERRQKLRESQRPDSIRVAADHTKKLLELLEKTGPMLTFQPAIFKDMVQKITVYPQKYCFHLVNGLVLEERRD